MPGRAEKDKHKVGSGGSPPQKNFEFLPLKHGFGGFWEEKDHSLSTC